MLNFSSANIQEIIVHFIGNKGNEEACSFSKKNITDYSKDLEKLLIDFFVSPFKNSELFEFYHHAGLKQNDIYTFCSEIFSNRKSTFIKNSKNIGESLYECSMHPKIKSGELCIIYFSQIILDDEVVDAIGIFKSEEKDAFIKFGLNDNGNYDIYEDYGVSTSKIEKGCLIFDTLSRSGFKVASIDNTNKINAQYWNDDFLKIRPCVDDFHQTKNFLNLTKDYLTKYLPEEFDVTKPDQIDLLNRSVEYFKTHDSFEKKEFEKDVLQDTNIIKSFRDFNQTFRETNELEINDSFEISPLAVKKQSRIFKSVLKLDKNFHIYIHGDKELIEKGIEKDGRKFYKIYYREEK